MNVLLESIEYSYDDIAAPLDEPGIKDTNILALPLCKPVRIGASGIAHGVNGSDASDQSDEPLLFAADIFIVFS
jgi:hypothetical protein